MTLTVEKLPLHAHIVYHTQEWEVEWKSLVPFPTVGLVNEKGSHTFLVCSPKQCFLIKD